MIRVGLTGGLASGKSYVASILESLGCHVLRADQVGHDLMRPGGAAFDEVVRQFGPEILGEDGAIDRRKLAAIVFGDAERLAQLNGIIHPLVFAREDEFMREVAGADERGIVVVEAAILIETGSYKRFDRLVVVVCTEEQRIARSMKRDGVTREQAEARLRRQMPLAEKRKYADYVIDTSGAKENTLEQAEALYRALRELEP